MMLTRCALEVDKPVIETLGWIMGKQPKRYHDMTQAERETSLSILMAEMDFTSERAFKFYTVMEVLGYEYDEMTNMFWRDDDQVSAEDIERLPATQFVRYYL